ncbi:MAG: HAMP domain-containing sensor histidine kinase [candidate division Zixibacteria bacterium]
MSPFFRIDDPLALNGLAAGLLLFQYIILAIIYYPRDKEKYRFFLYGCLAWTANLFYLWILDIGKNSPSFLPGSLSEAIVIILNTVTMFFFLAAAERQWRLNKKRHFVKLPVIYVASILALFIPLIEVLLKSKLSIAGDALAVSYGCAGLFVFGLAYHLYFRTNPVIYPSLTRGTIIYPIYFYALLQFGHFIPDIPLNNGQDAFCLHDLFHLAGMSAKIIHLLGLLSFSHYLFVTYAEYRVFYKEKSQLIADAQDALKVIRQLSHEIKTPKASFKLFIDIIKELPSTDKVELKSQSEKLAELAQKTVDVIDVFNKAIPDVDKGTSQKEKAIIDLNQLCNEAVRTLETVMLSNTAIRRKYEGDIWVEGHAAELHQVIRNLLKNAIEATKHCESPLVYLSTSVVSDETGTKYVKLLVCDNGPGVNDDIVDRIFQSGFSTKVGERGFGLEIARRITIKHGGTLNLTHSRGGRFGGAAFVLSLPHKSKRK